MFSVMSAWSRYRNAEPCVSALHVDVAWTNMNRIKTKSNTTKTTFLSYCRSYRIQLYIMWGCDYAMNKVQIINNQLKQFCCKLLTSCHLLQQSDEVKCWCQKGYQCINCDHLLVWIRLLHYVE